MRFKLTLIIVIVFALLLGYVYYYQTDNQTITDEQTPQVLKLNRDQINAIELLADDQKIKLIKKEGQWLLVEPKELKTDEYQINNLLDTLVDLTSDRIVVDHEQDETGEKKLDLTAYGLNEPQQKVVISLDDGNSVSLTIGDETPISGGKFVRKNNEDRVFRVASSILKVFDKNIDDLRDKRIVVFDPDQVAEVKLDLSEMEIELLQAEEEWFIKKPYYYPADAVNGLLNNLKSLEAKSFIDNPDSIDSYGLDQPQIKIDLVMNNQDKPLTVLFNEVASEQNNVEDKQTKSTNTDETRDSSEEDNAEVYAKVTDKETIYEIDNDSLYLYNIKDKEPEDFINKDLFDYENISDVEYVKIDREGKLLTVRPGASKKDKSEALKKAEDDLVRRISYRTAGSLLGSAGQFALDLTKPFLTITVKLKDNPEEKVVKFFRQKIEEGNKADSSSSQKEENREEKTKAENDKDENNAKEQVKKNYRYFLMKDFGDNHDYDKLLFAFDKYKTNDLLKLIDKVENPHASEDDKESEEEVEGD